MRCPDLRKLCRLSHDHVPAFHRALLAMVAAHQRPPPLKTYPFSLGDIMIEEHVDIMEHLLGTLEAVDGNHLSWALEAMRRRVKDGKPAAPSLRYVKRAAFVANSVPR
jgi:hypothetical protein